MARSTVFASAIPEVPDKQYFRIGEVSDLVGIKPHVLRYWETEFNQLNPTKSGSNQRLYRKKDIELVVLLKKLLYHDGFTISGARSRIRNRGSKSWKDLLAEPSSSLGKTEMVHLGANQTFDFIWQVREELQDLKEQLQQCYQKSEDETLPS